VKKILAVFGLLVGLAVLLLVFTSRTSVRVSLTGDAQQLETYSKKFLEDLQFKDFQTAASYHSRDDRKTVDIPNLIERLFGIKPEFLDIMRFDIVKVQIDSTGKRARVKCHSVVKILNTSEIKEPEIMLYFRKDPAEGWVMELQSSLH